MTEQVTGKVLILRWAGSAYDSVGGLLDLAAQALAADGFEVVLFSPEGDDWGNRLLQLLHPGGFSFALTMSGAGVDLTVNNKPLWEAVRVPLFNWSCDHPYGYPSRHMVQSPFLLHGYVFPDHARYHIQHLKPNGAAFAVHFGMPPRNLFPGAPLPLASRNGRIMFSKSGRDTNPIEAAWRDQPDELQQILFASAETLLHRYTGDFLPVLQSIAEPLGLFLDGNSLLTMTLFRELDIYLRFRRANLLMQTVRRYPVDVYGAGWEHLRAQPMAADRAAFHDAIPWRATVASLPSYLGCLSLNPLTTGSVHDRVFFALSAGAVPIADRNDFSIRHLPELQCYTFDLRPETIEQAIDAMLADPADALERTEAAARTLGTQFTLQHSVRQIVRFVGLLGMNARCDG